MSRALLVSCLVSALGLFGCETVLNLAEDPQVVETGPWRCLGKVSTSETPTKPTALVRVRPRDFVNNDNVTGLTAKLCSKLDVGCANPKIANIHEADGELRFEVPTTGFDGYLDITAATKHCSEYPAEARDLLCGMAVVLQQCDLGKPNDPACFIPTHAESMLFFNPPVTADMTVPLELPMLSLTSLPTIMQRGGVPTDQINMEGGNLFVTVRDCDGKPASGVTMSIPPQTDPDYSVFQLYVSSGVPIRDASETDRSGMGAFVGLAPKFIEVSAHTSDGRLIGKIGVQASPLVMTYSTLPAQ